MKSDMSYKPIGLSRRGKAFGRNFGRSSDPRKSSFRTIGLDPVGNVARGPDYKPTNPRYGLSTLSAKQRARLRSSQFAIPERRSYPIPDRAHARNALARVSQFGSDRERRRVRAAVHRKFPSIGFDFTGRPDTRKGMRHTSMGEKVYGFDRRKYYGGGTLTTHAEEKDIKKGDFVESRDGHYRGVAPADETLPRRHPIGCNCPFHGGHSGRKGGIGYNMKGIGSKTFPTPRRATI
jgi:hypothetical protein